MESVKPSRYFYLGGAIVTIIASIMPWEKVGAMTESGVELGRGVWTLLVGLVFGAVIIADIARRKNGNLKAWSIGSGVVVLLMFAAELIVLSRYCNGENNSLFNVCVKPSIGQGAILALLVGVFFLAMPFFDKSGESGK